MNTKGNGSAPSRPQAASKAPNLSHTPPASARPTLTGPDGESLTVRLMAKDKAKLAANAERAGLGVSEYARRVLMGQNVEPARPMIDEAGLAKLESIRGLIKQLWKSERFDTDEIFSEVNKTFRWLRDGVK